MKLPEPDERGFYHFADGSYIRPAESIRARWIAHRADRSTLKQDNGQSTCFHSPQAAHAALVSCGEGRVTGMAAPDAGQKPSPGPRARPSQGEGKEREGEDLAARLATMNQVARQSPGKVRAVVVEYEGPSGGVVDAINAAIAALGPPVATGERATTESTEDAEFPFTPEQWAEIKKGIECAREALDLYRQAKAKEATDGEQQA